MISTNVKEDMDKSSEKYLEEASTKRDSFISFSRDRLTWSFYFAQGKLLYATNSLDSFERLTTAAFESRSADVE